MSVIIILPFLLSYLSNVTASHSWSISDIFKLADSDGDRRLSPSEFLNIFSIERHKFPRSSDAEFESLSNEMLSSLDHENDGTISLAEFERHFQKGLPDAMLLHMERFLSRDGSSFIHLPNDPVDQLQTLDEHLENLANSLESGNESPTRAKELCTEKQCETEPLRNCMSDTGNCFFSCAPNSCKCIYPPTCHVVPAPPSTAMGPSAMQKNAKKKRDTEKTTKPIKHGYHTSEVV